MINLLYITGESAAQNTFETALLATSLETKHVFSNSLAEAAQTIKRTNFDLIFCDFHLKGQTVLELLSKPNLSEEIPVVVLSDRANVEIARDAFKAGAFNFFSQDELNPDIIKHLITSGVRASKENKLRLGLEKRLDSIYANTRTILDNTTDGIWSLDDDGKLLVMNSIARDNIKENGGRCPAIGEHFFDNIAPLFKYVWEPLFEQVLAGKEIITVDEYHDGDHRFFLELACAPITSNENNVGVSFVARNVTIREVAEAKVRESEKNFRSVFTGSEVPIMLTSVKNHEIVDLNDACATLHEYPHSEMVKMDVYTTIPEEKLSKFQSDFEEYRKGRLTTLDTFCLTSDNRSIPVEMAITEIFYNGEHCYLIFLYDISVRIETESRLEQARELAEKSAEFKSLFLANMSHEIRTPMNAMLGFADLLKKTKLDKEQIEYLDIIRNSGQDLLVIINDILDLTKIEAGKLTLRPERFVLSEAINKVMRLHKNRAAEKEIDLVLDLDSDLPEEIYMDDIRLTQILNNLISNSLKFTEAGEVSVKISMNGIESNPTIVILVRDTGIGIPEIELETIFENFNQVDSSLQRREKGTGLGLSIVHQLCELMEGHIVARSTVNEGSEFEVSLPLSLNFEQEEADSEIEKIQIISGELHILVCEDNPINIKLAAKILDDLGIHYQVARNGQEGVEAVKIYNPDVVFMDLQMPLMNGYEATREIRKFSKVPIIAMSAHVLEEEQTKCWNAGMNGFIPKPFQSEDIIAELRNQFSFGRQGESKKAKNKWKALNMPGLTNLSKGDESFTVSLFDIFIEQAKVDLNAFEVALENEDIGKQAALAHRLLPSFMTFNFVQLHIIAEKIEKASASTKEKGFFVEKLDEAIREIIEKRSSFIKGN